MTTAIVAVGAVTRHGGHVVPHFLAYRVAFLVAAVFSLVAVIGSLAIIDSEAAQTIRRRPRREPVRTGPVGAVAD